VLSCVERFARRAIFCAQNRIGAGAKTPQARRRLEMFDFPKSESGGGRFCSLSGSRESPLNQDEFWFERWRK
jgi:hypothetical protein